MTPRWLTVEKLVVELGGICASRGELEASAVTEAVARRDVEEAVGRATDAVGAVLTDLTQDDDEIVRTAWHAIAQAQNAVRRLGETAERSRVLRERGQRLQDQSQRLRRPRAQGRIGSRRASRRTDRD